MHRDRADCEESLIQTEEPNMIDPLYFWMYIILFLISALLLVMRKGHLFMIKACIIYYICV